MIMILLLLLLLLIIIITATAAATAMTTIELQQTLNHCMYKDESTTFHKTVQCSLQSRPKYRISTPRRSLFMRLNRPL